MGNGMSLSLFQTNNDARLGALNIYPLIPLPRLLNIVSEWAAILPLVIHLASHRNAHFLVGETAFLGKLSIDLFPKLGTLLGVARMLERGQEFLDQASVKGGSSQLVWDLQWGSHFPCANGAASGRVMEFARRQNRRACVAMPSKVPRAELRRESNSRRSFKESDAHCAASNGQNLETWGHRRYQTLHVYRFRQKVHRVSLLDRLERTLGRWPICAIKVVILALFVAAMLSLGLYGSATVLTCSAVSSVAATLAVVERPPSYMENNEAHKDVYTLVATHPNAMDWHLCIGERGIVDGLLNKTMVEVRRTHRNRNLAAWFRMAHVLQLLAMTFVAAQRAWDGVALLTVVCVNGFLRWRASGHHLARRWLDAQGVEVTSSDFSFSGRTIMLGAVQILSESRAMGWMDNIICPHPRRDAWLRLISGKDEPLESWNDHDALWIEISYKLSIEAAKVLKREIRSENV